MKTTDLQGILLLNKAQGMTSNKALQKVKHLLGIKKAGHTGSLDPLATGMLPLCFGEATKVCQYLLDADKCYETTGLLGIKTNSADATGEVIARTENFHIQQSQLENVLADYRGTISQIPSMYSALKHQGQPLYRYARNGIEIERKAREVHISQLVLDEFNGLSFSMTVSCTKGTYIRNLVEDIGDDLGVGAHVTRLHRRHTAGFENWPMHSLESLEAMSLSERLACLIPMDKAVMHFQALTLENDEVTCLRQGRVLKREFAVQEGDCVRLYDEHAQFVGLGEITLGELKAKRLLSY